MRKYLPFAALLILALASISFAQEPAPSPSPKPKPKMSKAQIQKNLAAAETKLWEAWKNKDVKPFKSALSADFVMIEDSGVSGKDAAIKEIASMPCEVKSYTLSDWKLTMINSGTALLTYKGTVSGTCGGTPIPTVWASSIWVNRGGKWMASSHQETPVKP
jgi:hypothetical protein